MTAASFVGAGLHLDWARLFVGTLASAGVTDVVLSPGSRSTPLSLAAAAEPRLRVQVVVDERSAAFFALGQARVTGRPSVLVCTSGTAGAHYLPAVIEAHESQLPLVVVTADRPWQLADCGAPQTVDQLKLFGRFARHFADLGAPMATDDALRAVVRVAAQAVLHARWPAPGPVHVNARFDKPLEPRAPAARDRWTDEVERLLERGAPSAPPPATVAPPELVAELASRCARAERGLLVCGPASAVAGGALRRAVAALARRTGFPVFAEATSQVRFGGAAEGVTSVGGLDVALRALRGPSDSTTPAMPLPDLVIEVGAPPTSGAWAELVRQRADLARWVVGREGMRDPAGRAAAFLLGEPASTLEAVAARLVDAPSERSRWASELARLDAVVRSAAGDELASGDLIEGAAVAAVVAACPPGSLLAVGNSLPVRHLDVYCPPGDVAVDVLHQRGASGIDGLVSGAAGAASVTRRAVTLLLGDLSLLHDLGGLAAARAVRRPLPIVVLANGGGGIFEQLPISDAVDRAVLERLFTTPQALDLGHAATAFGLSHRRVRERAGLEQALAEAHAADGPMLVEIVVPPGDAARRAEELLARVASRAGPAADSVTRSTKRREEEQSS